MTLALPPPPPPAVMSPGREVRPVRGRPPARLVIVIGRHGGRVCAVSAYPDATGSRDRRGAVGADVRR